MGYSHEKLERRTVNLGLPLWVQLAKRCQRTDRRFSEEVRFLVPHGVEYLFGARTNIRRWVESQDSPYQPAGENETHIITFGLPARMWTPIIFFGEQLAQRRTRSLRSLKLKAGKASFVSESLRLLVSRGIEVIRKNPSLDPRPGLLAREKRLFFSGFEPLPSLEETFPEDDCLPVLSDLIDPELFR